MTPDTMQVLNKSLRNPGEHMYKGVKQYANHVSIHLNVYLFSKYQARLTHCFRSPGALLSTFSLNFISETTAGYA